MKKLSIDGLREQFPVVYDFILTHDMAQIAEQRYELGDNVYVNVESYYTYEFKERRYESHTKYLDIQYLILGEEDILVVPVEELEIDEIYNPHRDISFYKNNVRGIDNILKAGDMLLLMPEDGHMPCIAVTDSVYVKKAVFKIPLK